MGIGVHHLYPFLLLAARLRPKAWICAVLRIEAILMDCGNGNIPLRLHQTGLCRHEIPLDILTGIFKGSGGPSVLTTISLLILETRQDNQQEKPLDNGLK